MYIGWDFFVIIFFWVSLLTLVFRIKNIEELYKYRKDKELNGQFRLIESSFDLTKTVYIIENRINGEWTEFKNLGDINIVKAQKEFLKFTKPFIVSVKKEV